MTFVGGYVPEFSMVLGSSKQGNRLFPEQMRYHHDEATAKLLRAFLGIGRLRLWTRLPQDRQLLPKSQIFQQYMPLHNKSIDRCCLDVDESAL